MSKYGISNKKSFKRNARDFYPTPYEAVLPLLPYLNKGTIFTEPCAGDYRLSEHLIKHNHVCENAFDIEPQDSRVICKNALDIKQAKMFITNPPFYSGILYSMIDHLRSIAPTWLLLPSDKAYNKTFGRFMNYCSNMIAVGRVRWIEGSKMASTDNFAWYKFENNKTKTTFNARGER